MSFHLSPNRGSFMWGSIVILLLKLGALMLSFFTQIFLCSVSITTGKFSHTSTTHQMNSLMRNRWTENSPLILSLFLDQGLTFKRNIKLCHGTYKEKNCKFHHFNKINTRLPKSCEEKLYTSLSV